MINYKKKIKDLLSRMSNNPFWLEYSPKFLVYSYDWISHKSWMSKKDYEKFVVMLNMEFVRGVKPHILTFNNFLKLCKPCTNNQKNRLKGFLC